MPYTVTNRSVCDQCKKTWHKETHEVEHRPLNKEITWIVTCDNCKPKEEQDRKWS